MALVQKSLQRIGNSTGLVLPADVLREAGMQREDEVLAHAEARRITITRLDPGPAGRRVLYDAILALAAGGLGKEALADWLRGRAPRA